MNQILNIEETNSTREVEEIIKEFERRMPLITSHGLLLEARLTPTNYEKMKDWLRITLHHQLQKARQDWLREEIVKLEGMKVCNNKAYRLPDAYVAEISYDKAIQTIIDRYQAEVDQDKALQDKK